MFLIVVERGICRKRRCAGGIFCPLTLEDVLANLATTSRAMDKWVLRLDLARRKGPEITLEGILIVAEGCFTAERMDRAE